MFFVSVSIFILGLITLLASSGRVIEYVFEKVKKGNKLKNKGEEENTQKQEISEEEQKKIDTGFIIGKCENILIYMFVWKGDLTALALIFAAKTIVRQEDIKKDSLYYLAGTMINLTYSLILSLTMAKLDYKIVSLLTESWNHYSMCYPS